MSSCSTVSGSTMRLFAFTFRVRLTSNLLLRISSSSAAESTCPLWRTQGPTPPRDNTHATHSHTYTAPPLWSHLKAYCIVLHAGTPSNTQHYTMPHCATQPPHLGHRMRSHNTTAPDLPTPPFPLLKYRRGDTPPTACETEPARVCVVTSNERKDTEKGTMYHITHTSHHGKQQPTAAPRVCQQYELITPQPMHYTHCAMSLHRKYTT